MNFVNAPEAQLVMHIQCDQLLADKCKAGEINWSVLQDLIAYSKYGGTRPATTFNRLGGELAGTIYEVYPSYQEDKKTFKISLLQLEHRPKVYKLTVSTRPEGSEELFEKIYQAVQAWVDTQNG